MTDFQTFVNEERGKLLDRKDGIKQAIITCPTKGQTVAIGLLAMDDVGQSKEWFDALTDEWIHTIDVRWNGSYKKEPRQSAQMGPWNECIDGIYSAVLGQSAVEEVAEEVNERATAAFIDDLENRSLAHRIDLARALSSYLLDTGTVEEHATALENAVKEQDKPWAVARYLPYVRVLRGLNGTDVSEVEAGIDGLLEFHRDHVASARDADAVQKAVALDATAMLTLARREGMAITIEDELIPDALNDDEYYPVGNER